MREDAILSPSQVGQYLKNMMDRDRLLSRLLVRGELSNYKMYPSGHHYFTLKDGEGSLRCVMFRSDAQYLRFRPENGMQVIAAGRVTVFPRDGQYQMYCARLTPEGVGDLALAFEQLKEKLAQEGLFDPSRKKEIPEFPGEIALITSPAGAAVRDMIRILGARWPLTRICVIPVRVQGEEAPQEIAAAIQWANLKRVADLIITGRGGGSMEDLWAFNEEIVARAIYRSDIPIISAVGHEPDVTIADFVADLRAPTPSAAAELAVYDIEQLEDRLSEYAYTMQHMCRRTVRYYRQVVEQYSVRLRYLSPLNTIRNRRTQALSLEERLQNLMEKRLRDSRHRMAIYVEQMKGLSPLDKLNQGYAYAADEHGKTLTSIEQVSVGDAMTVYVKDGRLLAQVTDKWQKEEVH